MAHADTPSGSWFDSILLCQGVFQFQLAIGNESPGPREHKRAVGFANKALIGILQGFKFQEIRFWCRNIVKSCPCSRVRTLESWRVFGHHACALLMTSVLSDPNAVSARSSISERWRLLRAVRGDGGATVLIWRPKDDPHPIGNAVFPEARWNRQRARLGILPDVA